jgi:hypothetical protein
MRSQQSRRSRIEPAALPVRPNTEEKRSIGRWEQNDAGSDRKSIRSAQMRSSGLFVAMCFGGQISLTGRALGAATQVIV